MQVLDKKNLNKFNIVWLRRDLRLHDHRAFELAATSDLPILPLFIFDKRILNELADDEDLRVNFIHEQVSAMNEYLKRYQSGVYTRHGTAEKIFAELFDSGNVEAVYYAEDFEPYAIKRDNAVQQLAKKHGVAFQAVVDHLIFHPGTVLKQDATPYHVYTPYSRRWMEHADEQGFKAARNDPDTMKWAGLSGDIVPLDQMGFKGRSWAYSATAVTSSTIVKYQSLRDFPAQDATSRLGIHLRFGTISIRQLAAKARRSEDKTFLKQLIWREFFTQIMYHHPESMEMAFKPKYRDMPWKFNETHFEKWKSGETGVPIVDAGMRELNATGWMHNRVRMIAASWLTKNLLIHWKLGERYFASKLLDFELASNVGSWQWVAGTGCDAAPYFRIFNPFTQQKKFDPKGDYIRKWVPEIDNLDYPAPMIDYKQSRKDCLEFFQKHANS